jgi:hypothetical protein
MQETKARVLSARATAGWGSGGALLERFDLRVGEPIA